MAKIPEIRASVAELEELLKDRVVEIVFYKLNNTMRIAHGTQSLEIIPEGFWPKGVKKAPSSVICFYDVDIESWRCLRKDRLIGYIRK